MMQTELHTIATHDAAQDTSSQVSQVPLQVAGGQISSTTNASDWHASEPAGASNRGNKHGHRSSTPGFTDSEHTCMAGYSGPGPKAWIDQCSGDHAYYACSMRNCRTSTHIDFMLDIADQSPGSDPLKLFSLMLLHDKGIMVLILSMARERAQGGHMFIDVSTGSFATILMLSAG